MVLAAKILIIAGVLLLDVGLFLFLFRLLLKKGLPIKLTGIIIIVAALILGAGAFLNPDKAGSPANSATVNAQVYSTRSSK